mmetsp:Transcript_33573/g.96288  ORF Transcript_33573/g.96288 Transcript_33573/m.96288 type:complete len:1064 (-) Transcript_33573:41-3232(-)
MRPFPANLPSLGKSPPRTLTARSATGERRLSCKFETQHTAESASLLLAALHAALHNGDAVSQAESDALCSGADADAAGELAVRQLLDGDVGKRVLAEYGLRIEVHRHEARRLDERLDADRLLEHVLHILGSQLALFLILLLGALLVAPAHDRHVRVAHDVLQKGADLGDGGVDVDLVLPLELRPHGAEGQLADPGPLDVIKDVHVKLIQDCALLVGRALLLVRDVAEDDAGLGARDLDGGVHHHLLAGRQRHTRRAVNQLQVALGAQLDEHILQRLRRAINHQQLQDQVEGVHLQEGLHVDWVRQARHLLHLGQALSEERAVGRRLAGDGGAAGHAEVVVVLHGGTDVAAALALPELPEDDALVGPHALLLDLGLGAEGPLGVLRGELQDLRELGAALRGGPFCLHQLRGRQVTVGQGAAAIADHQPNALRQPERAVAALASAGMPLHDLVHVDEHKEHLVLETRAKALLLEHELGQGHADHGGEEEVSTDYQRPKLGLFLAVLAAVSSRRLIGGSLFVHVLRGVGAVGQNDGLGGDLGGDRRRLLAVRLRLLLRGIGGFLALRLGLLGNQWKRLQSRDEVFDDGLDELRLLGVLAEQPKAAAEHARLLDVGDRLRQALQDRDPQVGVVRDELPEEHDDLGRRGLVGLREEVHEQEHDALGLLRILARARVERADEEAAVLEVALNALGLVAEGLDDLLLEEGDDILDVARADKAAEADVHDLLAHVKGWAAEGAEDVHDHAFHHLPMVLLHLLQSIQNDELHVVVGLLSKERHVCRSRLMNGDRRRRERHQRGCAVVGHGRRRGGRQVEDDAQKPAFVRGAGAADLPHKLEDGKLEDVAHGADLILHAEDVLDRPVLVAIQKHQESIALGGEVALHEEQLLDVFGGLRHHVQAEALDDRVHAHDGIPPHVGVPVAEIPEDSLLQGLKDSVVLHLAQQAQGRAANVLVGVHEVIAEGIAHQNHFLLQIAILLALVDNLPVDHQQLLDPVVRGGDDELDDGHQQLGISLAIDHEKDQLLQGLSLYAVFLVFEPLAKIIGSRRHTLVIVDEDRAMLLGLRSHRCY